MAIETILDADTTITESTEIIKQPVIVSETITLQISTTALLGQGENITFSIGAVNFATYANTDLSVYTV
jgi:hypothetical protein